MSGERRPASEDATGRNRYAVCQNVLRGADLATNIAWAADAGAAAIALDTPDVVAAGVETTRQLLADRGLAVSSLMRSLGGILRAEGGPTAEEEKRVAEVVGVCADLGAPGIGLTTGPLGDLSIAEADRRCQAWLRRMAPMAAERDVLLLLEPVHPLLQWASYVHSLRHAAELTGGLAGTGLLLDVGHLWWDRGFDADVASLGPQLGSVQIDDVDGEAAKEFRYARVQLGEGILPLADLVAVIEAAGYEGYYENEIGARIPKSERVAFARGGGEWLAQALADLEA